MNELSVALRIYFGVNIEIEILLEGMVPILDNTTFALCPNS